MAAEFTAIEAAYQAAEAANKLADSLRTATEGMTQLETDLEAVKKATQGTGRAQHELATQGMSEAEIATYNYNASLRGQIMVLMDAANGTENASENMKDLANEAVKLAIDLKRAQGDIAGANRDQMMLDTKGFTADEVAAYDNNRRIKDEIAAIEDGAGAADNARQAEEDLARTRYELAARLDVLTGRKTQLEIDRHAELLGVTDEAVISLSKMIWVLEDLKSVVDKAFASIGRAVEAEKKSLAEAYQAALDLNKTATDAASTALTSATDLFNALKSTASVVEVGMTRDQAKVQLDAILSMQRMTGMLPTAASMSAMLKVLGENDEASFKTALDYKLDQAKSAAKLNELARAAGKQVSIEQLTLDQLKDEAELLKTAYEAEIKRLDEILTVAQAQLDKLNGIDTSIISVADAVKAFDKSLADLATAIAGTPANSTPDPVTGGSGGSGGGGSGSGASGADATPKFENIAGQENKDIVRAYREYYNRNPDDVGYKAFIDSKLTGDKLMQAILRASAANPEGEDYQMAVKRGYNPLEPMKKFLKSLESTGTGAAYQEPTNYAFATGINNVPFDMNARIHKGERILPAADNRELFARLQSPKEGNEVLVLALRDMSAELSKVKTELIQIKDSNKKMKDLAEKDDAIGTAPARAAL